MIIKVVFNSQKFFREDIKVCLFMIPRNDYINAMKGKKHNIYYKHLMSTHSMVYYDNIII